MSAITDDPDVFKEHPKYASSSWRHAQTLRMADAELYYPDKVGNVPETAFGKIVGNLPAGKNYPAGQAADLPETIDGVKRDDTSMGGGKTAAGDFDTGIGSLADGPFCGKAV